MRKKLIESYKGINQDISPSKFPDGFYYDATNIRVIPNDDEQTTYQVINEKGNTSKYTFTPPYGIYTGVSPNYKYATVFDLDSTKTYSYHMTGVTNDADLAASAGGETISKLLATRTANYIENDITQYSDFKAVSSVQGRDYTYVLFYMENSASEPLNAIYAFSDTTAQLIYVEDLGVRLDEDNPENCVLPDMKYFYENDNIQTLYVAVAGKQVIRIPLVVDLDQSSTYDNFIGDMELVPDVDFGAITVTDSGTGGSHTAGIIQYAYSYYKLNGQSSTISPLTQIYPLYTSTDIGAPLNSIVGQINQVTIDDLDQNFDVINIYSIKYNTSTDIPTISLISEDEVIDTSITIYDDNTVISTVSLEEFVFLGGTIVKPSTIDIKDNRLFVGNFDEDTFNINNNLEPGDANYFDSRAFKADNSDVYKFTGNVEVEFDNNVNIYTASGDPVAENDDCIPLDSSYRFVGDPDSTGFPQYFGARGADLLIYLSPTTTTDYRLKFGETYRFGLMFMDDKGIKSPIHWITDLTIPHGEDYTGAGISDDWLSSEMGYNVVLQINSVARDKLEAQGVSSVQLMRVERTANDISVGNQGIVSTMLFQTKDNSAAEATSLTTATVSPTAPYSTNQYSEAFSSRELAAQVAVKQPSIIPRTSFTMVADGSSGSTKYPGFQKYKHLSALGSDGVQVQITAANINDSLYDDNGSSYSNLYLDDYTLTAGAGTIPYPEISTDSTNYTNMSFQYTKMWQIFNPDAHLGELNPQLFNRVRILGNYVMHGTPYDDHRIQDSNNCYVTGKRYDETTGSVNDSATPNFGYILNRNLMIGDSTGGMVYLPAANYTDHIQYFTYPTVFHKDSVLYEYSIYGTPELAERGENNLIYNNDSNYKYNNSLKTLENDDASYSLYSVNTDCEKSTFIVPYSSIISGTTVDEPINHLRLEETRLNGSYVDNTEAMLVVAELYRADFNQYGGNTYEARSKNTYMPITNAVLVDDSASFTSIKSGDTFLHKYNAMTHGTNDTENYTEGYPTYSHLLSVNLETTVNLNSRYDISKNFNTSQFIESFTNYSQYNSVYSREGNTFKVSALPFNLTTSTSLSNNIRASKVKTPGELVDSFSDILVNEELALDGKYGELNKLFTHKDKLYAFQDKGVSYISVNPRAQIVGDDGISVELGTGNVLDRYQYLSTTRGLKQHDRNTVKESDHKLYFFNRDDGSLDQLYGGQVSSLSISKGMNRYFRDITKYVTSMFDEKNKEYLITESGENTLKFSELIDAFHTTLDINSEYWLPYNSGIYNYTSVFSNIFSFNESYVGDRQSCDITFIITPDNGYGDCRFDNIEWQSVASDPSTGAEDLTETFTAIRAWNAYQNTSNTTTPITFSTYDSLYQPKRKFRKWRVPFPRDYASNRDRLRSPYLFLTLQYLSPDDNKFEFKDLVIYYNI